MTQADLQVVDGGLVGQEDQAGIRDELLQIQMDRLHQAGLLLVVKGCGPWSAAGCCPGGTSASDWKR